MLKCSSIMAKKRTFVLLIIALIMFTRVSVPQKLVAAQSTPSDPYVCWEDTQTVAQAGQDIALLSNITLVSFCVEYYSVEDQVLVTWLTATELNTSGYYIERGDTPNGTYTRISPLIPAEGGLVSWSYEWEDTTAQKGRVYYYKLAEIDINNATSGLFGPIQFDLFSPTPTTTSTTTGSTATRTPTPTQSLTPTTGPSSTATLTLIPNPTATRTPRPTATIPSVPTNTPAVSPTFTPEITETQAVTVEITSTATLEPLPPIVLLFPAPTATPVPTSTTVAQSTSQPADVARFDAGVQAQITGRIRLLGGIILVLWVALSAFLVVFLHKAHE